MQIPKFLPAVPEPPQFQRPPPTPRPTRLPTPDLDDLSDHEFCCCDHSFGRGHCGERGGRGLSSKMDAQSEILLPKHLLEVANFDPVLAAQAYMKDRRC